MDRLRDVPLSNNIEISAIDVKTDPNLPKSEGRTIFKIGPINIPININNITLGILVFSKKTVKICEKNITNPNPISTTDIFILQ
jgi:hypothetical protein